jgi:hypothetical protein
VSCARHTASASKTAPNANAIKTPLLARAHEAGLALHFDSFFIVGLLLALALRTN